jgi:hypothetical protein
MPQARQSNGFLLLDYSKHIELVPRVHTLVGDMNLFSDVFGNSTVAQAERVNEKTGLISARKRGGERNFVDSEDVRTENFNIPFFPLDRHIKAADIQNFREYGTGNESKTLEKEVARVMARIKRFHAQLKERAMVASIMGTSWAPGDTDATYNYYTVWGLTQATAPVNFTTTTIDPRDVIEDEARTHIIDEAADNAGEYRIIAICSRKYFSALIAHPLVENAYQFYDSAQEPLRRRLGGDVINRMFESKGVLYIEDISGYFGTDDAYIMPLGIEDMFKNHFAPADIAQTANDTAQELYLWYKQSDYFRDQKLESETSFISINARPELVVKSVGTYS